MACEALPGAIFERVEVSAVSTVPRDFLCFVYSPSSNSLALLPEGAPILADEYGQAYLVPLAELRLAWESTGREPLDGPPAYSAPDTRRVSWREDPDFYVSVFTTYD